MNNTSDNKIRQKYMDEKNFGKIYTKGKLIEKYSI